MNPVDMEQFGASMLEHLPVVHAPDRIWNAVEAALDQPPVRPRRRIRPLMLLLAAAAMAAVLFWSIPRHGVRWDVVRIHGSEHRNTRVGPGQSIDTDAGSRAIVTVGTIGTVDVSPNTKLRVIATQPGDHRLALTRGEIHATISAPPRLFFVETAAGTAIDLGCEYSLRTGEDGEGLLQVTRGWVSFQWNGVESLVPAGASCRTKAAGGPGIPYFDDASDTFKQALDSLDSLDTVLSAARVRDTLSLWHLLWRVAPADRARVYDRMAALTPVPAGVSRDLALRLDPATLARWKDELAWTW
jgi:ferric-dicitrate binding protein FerR (iron transport regulator)